MLYIFNHIHSVLLTSLAYNHKILNLGTDRFLPGHPLDLLKKRKFDEIPLILGFNAQEAAFMIPLLMTSLERGKSKFKDLFNLEATSELEVR